MKHIPVIFVFLLGMLSGAAVVRLRAFGRFHPPKPEMIAERMARDLGLDETQKKRLKDVFAAHEEEMRSLHKDALGRFEALRGRIDAEIEGILTPDQKVEFARFRERAQAKRPRPDGFFMPPPGIDRR